MRLNQYIVTIPIDTLREALNISDDIEYIEQVQNIGKETITLIVQANHPLSTIKGRAIPEVRLEDIQNQDKSSETKSKRTWTRKTKETQEKPKIEV